MFSSLFSLFNQTKPVLPIAAPPASPRPPPIVRGSIAVWNSLIALVILLLTFFASFFSLIASSLERFATTVGNFRVVLSSSVGDLTFETVTPESLGISVPLSIPSPVFDPANPRSPHASPHRHFEPPTYTPQPHSDVDSSLQIAIAFQIINDILIKGKSTHTCKWLLADHVIVGYTLMLTSLGPVLSTRKHICDIVSDFDREAHLVWREADPALQLTPPPRVDVSFPGPICLDISANPSQIELESAMDHLGSLINLVHEPPAPVERARDASVPVELPSGMSLAQTGTIELIHTKSSRRAAAIYGAPVDTSLNTTIATQVEENQSASGPVSLFLPASRPDSSMDTSSSDTSLLPTPVDPKFPNRVVQLQSAASPEVSPAHGSLLGEVAHLPSSLSVLLDEWNPPATFAYVEHSPSQGVTRPIVARQPGMQTRVQESPSVGSLRPVASSVSLFANEWTPPANFQYDHQTSPLGATRPIVPRNRRRELQIRPGDLAPVPKAMVKDVVCATGDKLSRTSSARSMKRYGMYHEPQETVEKLVSGLHGSVSAPVFSSSY